MADQPESTSSMLHNSLQRNGDFYAFSTNPYPLRENTIVDQRFFIAPAAGTVLAGLTAQELPAGYYQGTVSWGILKLQGSNDPAPADITNFASYAGETKLDDLAALGVGSLTTVSGWFNFDGTLDFSFRTKIQGSAGVAYTAIIVLTRIAK